MEISDVKRRVTDTIARARRQAADHRTRIDEATRDYETFLDQRAIPVIKQVANVLRVEGFAFTVFTPGGSVRLASDRGTQDYIELAFDTSADDPVVRGHTSRSRGRRVLETNQAMGSPASLGEEDVLAFVLKALEGLVER
jgi:hypothetical protein